MKITKRFALLATMAALMLCFAAQALAAGYLANTKSGKYHISTCRTIKHPNAAHFVPYNSASECEAAGFTPCGVCLK